jgi:solute carrier family 30 (zinc transporter), member 9
LFNRDPTLVRSSASPRIYLPIGVPAATQLECLEEKKAEDSSGHTVHHTSSTASSPSVRDPFSNISAILQKFEATERRRATTNKDTNPKAERERRLRAGLTLFHALAQATQQKRHFSSADDATTKKGQALTDQDFAEYLTGNVEDEAFLKSSVRSKLKSLPPQENIVLPTDQKITDTMESYGTANRDNQKRHMAKNRAKTKHNIQRALAGNVVIAGAKLAAWVSSGSSSMLSEFVHSLVDCGNQALLLIGLWDSDNVADGAHPYGYGKSVYFWALVSALGTFFLGAGVAGTAAVGELMDPHFHAVTWQVWAVLLFSLSVDGYIISKTLTELNEEKPKGVSLYAYIKNLRDPATLAILLEDGAACMGVVMAAVGIALTHATGMPVFDGLAGVGISGLLATMGIVLVRVNHRFLLGHSVDSEITKEIEKILLGRRSIDHVHSVQSQWTGPETFSYKAEVDFDGTYLAAKLMPRYQEEFLEAKDTLDQDLRVLLSWYAEDVMRTVEREVRSIENDIRKVYPGAEYIELEPMSKDSDRFAIDDGMEAQLRRMEIEELNRYLKSLYHTKKKDGSGFSTTGDVVNPLVSLGGRKSDPKS